MRNLRSAVSDSETRCYGKVSEGSNRGRTRGPENILQNRGFPPGRLLQTGFFSRIHPMPVRPSASLFGGLQSADPHPGSLSENDSNPQIPKLHTKSGDTHAGRLPKLGLSYRTSSDTTTYMSGVPTTKRWRHLLLWPHIVIPGPPCNMDYL